MQQRTLDGSEGEDCKRVDMRVNITKNGRKYIQYVGLTSRIRAMLFWVRNT